MGNREMKVTLNDLVAITGKNFRTIKQRLTNVPSTPGPYSSILYELKDALRAILDGDKADPTRMAEYRTMREEADAKLSAARAEKIKLQIDEMKGLLIKKERAEAFVSNLVIHFKSKLLAIPSRAALQVAGCDDPNDVEHLLQGEMNTVLTELSEINFNDLSRAK
jgi:hypothetical protein